MTCATANLLFQPGFADGSTGVVKGDARGDDVWDLSHPVRLQRAEFA
jgi:hypothetical protein